jgi:hypothetical protein
MHFLKGTVVTVGTIVALLIATYVGYSGEGER